MENNSRVELFAFPINNNDDLSYLSDLLLINFERIDYSFVPPFACEKRTERHAHVASCNNFSIQRSRARHKDRIAKTNFYLIAISIFRGSLDRRISLPRDAP